ncbi:MAG: FliM/FliN family flagellar motor switch protein [Alphaproteobacteria bacterium]|nr:FliM/FliN family flagellar motor switch protein [Alphaproteobacteria bacterium]
MSQAPAGGREAIERLFRHPELSMERLPVLKDAMTSLTSDCAEGLRALCPHPAAFAIERTTLCHASEVLEQNQHGIAYVFHAAGWDSRIVIGFGRAAVFLLVESVFGGDGNEQSEAPERPFSKLEQRLVQKVADLAAQSLNRFLDGTAPIGLSLERVEAAISPGMFGPADPAVAVFEMDLQLQERTAGMFVMLPQSSIHALRSKLERRDGNPSLSVDEEWAGRLRSGVENTTVSLRAAIHGYNSTLGEVAALQVGSVIELPLDAHNSVVATCNGAEIFAARLVQSKGHYALSISAFINRNGAD